MAKNRVTADVRLPKVPNFLRYGDGDGQVLDVADIPLPDLRTIAQLWGDALVKNHIDRNVAREAEGEEQR